MSTRHNRMPSYNGKITLSAAQCLCPHHLENMRSYSPAPVVIDLFCGAGGLSEGLRQAGLDPRVGVDFDRNAISTYRHNHPNSAGVLADVSELTGPMLQELAGTDDIDLIAGGPSCQGFSTHGKRIQDDPRNFLFQHFVRLVGEIRPKMFLMENVKGMLTYSKGLFKSQIEKAFEEIGYRTEFKAVCAADYGVPQLRHRVLFLGTRLETVRLSFPKPTHGPNGPLKAYVTVEEALSDLPLIEGRYKQEIDRYASPPKTPFQRYARAHAGRELTLHTAGPLSTQAQRIADFVKPGQGLRAVPERVLPERFKRMRKISSGGLRRDCTTLYYRLAPERPSYTITCHYRNVASGPFLHPYEDRALTHREAARLMSFPDRYRFVGTAIPRQIGNAVPVLMAKAIGAEIVKSLCEAESVNLERVA